MGLLEGEGVVNDRCDQDALYTCMKLSKTK